MIMRFLAIADTHLGYEAGKTTKARKFIYEHMFSAFEEVLEIARKEKVDFVLHGGDIFNRSNPRTKVIKRAYQLIENLLKDDIGFLIAPGNHERSKLPNTLLQYHPKSHFFHKMELLELTDCNILEFPFQKEITENFRRTLNEHCKVKNEKPILLLCHQLFDGATFSPRKFRFGLHHGAIDPLPLPVNITLIVTGHIHRAQSLMNGLIVYPGSVERTSFVESIEPKGYLLIDITLKKLTVNFNVLETLQMNVLEINLLNDPFDLQSLENIILKGYTRTLLRFTGRQLTTSELELLRNTFPSTVYPLLTIAPQFPRQLLKPLYIENNFPFTFHSIFKEL